MANTLLSSVRVREHEITDIGTRLDDQSRRNMQETITVSLIGLLGALFVFLFAYVVIAGENGGLGANFDKLKDLLNIVVGPLVALLSTVVGFYFGSKAVKDAGERS